MLIFKPPFLLGLENNQQNRSNILEDDEEFETTKKIKKKENEGRKANSAEDKEYQKIPAYNKRKADILKDESQHLEEVIITKENTDKTATKKTRKESKPSKSEKSRELGNNKKTSKENIDNIKIWDDVINLEDVDDLLDEETKKKGTKLPARDVGPEVLNLTYKLKNKAKEFQIKET